MVEARKDEERCADAWRACGVRLDDFVVHMPTRKFVFLPTGVCPNTYSRSCSRSTRRSRP